MSHDVFISYSNNDKPVADAVCAGLEARGARCWIAPRDILPGKSWSTAIMDGIRECPIMVVIFSSASNTSKQVLREIERAVNQNMTIVPYRIEDIEMSDDLEYFLSVPHWLDALTPDTEAHVARLGDTIQALLGAAGDPPAAPLPRTQTPTQTRSTPASKAGLYAGIGGLAVALLVAIALLVVRPWESDTPKTDPSPAMKTVPDTSEHSPDAAPLGPAEVNSEPEEFLEGIEIRTVPPGAEIRIDGELRGTTPTEVTLDPGDYYVEVSLAGFEGAGEKVKVVHGMVEEIEFTLVAVDEEVTTAESQDSGLKRSSTVPQPEPEPEPEPEPVPEPEPEPKTEPKPKPKPELKPRKAPEPARTPPAIELRVSRVRISGALEDDDETAVILSRRWGKLTSCHRKHLTGNLAGASVNFTVMVDDLGDIDESSATPDSGDYLEFLGCCEDAFSGVAFPESDGFSTIRFRVGK